MFIHLLYAPRHRDSNFIVNMARNRPSSRRRRVWRKAREMEEKGQAEAASDPAQASTTEAATSASAHDAKDTADETKARPCKHRHLPVCLLPFSFFIFVELTYS
jgi:hypothetical protein